MSWRSRSIPAIAAVVLLSACGNEPVDVATERVTTDASQAPAHMSAAGAKSTSTTGTPLYALLSSSQAAGATGRALTARLGGKTYRGATGIWVGCEGAPAKAVYGLDGEFNTLTGVLGLQVHTPQPLVVAFTITVDGAEKLSATMRRDDPPRDVAIDVRGARTVVIAAVVWAGDCAPAPAPYGAIGAASLN